MADNLSEKLKKKEIEKSICIGVKLDRRGSTQSKTVVNDESAFLDDMGQLNNFRNVNQLASSRKRVVVMVGLPARGKSYVSYKLSRHLNWIGIKTRVFNVGTYRRAHVVFKDHSFFDPHNEKTMQLRNNMAKKALDDLCDWFETDDKRELAIFDATNTTRERRKFIFSYLEERLENVKIMIIESICNDENVIHDNIIDVKLNSPDYADQKKIPKSKIISDFKKRIEHYEKVYEPMCPKHDADISYICIYNQGKQYFVNNVIDIIESRICYYIMNIRVITNKVIYLTRHGESNLNVENKLGGDSGLSVNGEKYAQALADFFNLSENKKMQIDEYATCSSSSSERYIPLPDIKIWTSTMQRCLQTIKYMKNEDKNYFRSLNELNTGVCENLTYAEIKEKFPNIYQERKNNKFFFRYPNGESYQDLVQRCEPLIMQLESESHVLVVTHQAVIRCIFAYFMNYDCKKIPYIDIPLHTVIKITPYAYGCNYETIPFDIEAVDTYNYHQ